ncbi:glycosyltransferase family A protein [Pseudochrobactrum sp. B5]|uniref:glycosyltransferase family 2 protein n=1 Tax=Pseudochrobactrum sp. B5 TaxID=1289478 RepID=UPI0009F845BA|nr:glycosyltransferase family A protein [Pseudochrobactrum sp. B5]
MRNVDVVSTVVEVETSAVLTSDKNTVVVIIPYYNGSKYIERAAQSVLNQTIKATEFVVVNDGSTVEETNKLNEIAAKMGFQVLHKENGGQGSARNWGVKHSNSKFISFLDQDDFYLKTHIETLIKGVEQDDPHFGWVYADLMEADEEGNIVRSDMVTYHSSHPKRFINDLINSDMHVLPSASLISRDAFEDVGGFDAQFMGYEDDDLFMRIFRKGYTNYFIPKAVTVWCINTNSTSYSIRMSRSRLKYIQKLCATFSDDPDRSRYYIRDLVVPRFTNLVVGEAYKAIMPATTPQELKMAAHKDELISIMNEYIQTILANTVLPRRSKIKLMLQSKIINTRNPILMKSSMLMYKFIYSLKSTFRFR